ncbi:MAG: hypothetical protein HY833_02440 [Candidatus Aenigmarchaeota archaeon]|nr:hypothetical protein [Candidatus Aenigmarchaeota archaeon]
MFNFRSMFSRPKGARRGDGATYGLDYNIGATYEIGGKKNYAPEKDFRLGVDDFYQLFRDYSSITENFKSVRNVNVLVKPISAGFDSSLLRKKVDAAVRKIVADKAGLRENIDLLASNSLMHDSPLLQEYLLKEERYNSAIKGAGLIYEWIKRHEESGDALKA